MSIKQNIVIRIRVFFIFIILICGGILYSIYHTQYVKGDYYRDLAQKTFITDRTIEPMRGNIITEDGDLLATSVPIYELRMDLRATGLSDSIFEAHLLSIADGLSDIFNEESALSFKLRLREARIRGDRYYLLKRKVSHTQLKLVKSLPLFEKGRNISGLIIVPGNRREMPFKTMAQRTIGYSRNGVQVGLEGAFNHFLAGVEGKQLVQLLAGGIYKPLQDEAEIEAENGKDIVTTLDVSLQDFAEDALLKGLRKHNAEHGTVILMEVATGYIKAISNLAKEPNGNYSEQYNYALGESSEPGSTFKLMALLVGLESGCFKITDSVDLRMGEMRFGNRIMKDSEKHSRRKTTIQHAFELSSNVGISDVINKCFNNEPEKFVQGLRNLHLNQPIGFQIPGEVSPYMIDPNSKFWNKTNTLPWLSVGYNVRITPMQTLTIYNAIANNGTMVRPQLVKEVRKLSQPIARFETVVINKKIASNSTIKDLQAILLGVVENGTAKTLKNESYLIAGKTGTAQIATGKTGYTKGNYLASFAGYFPADAPKYSMIVVVKNPRNGAFYGGSVAAPIFKEIADKVYANKIMMEDKTMPQDLADSIKLKQWANLSPGIRQATEALLDHFDVQWKGNMETDWVKPHIDQNKMRVVDLPIDNDAVPNLIGMGLIDALYLLESRGLSVKVNGRGKVVRQSVPAGSKPTATKQIIIDLG